MTINERFFSLLSSSNCTQKRFSQTTGISEKTISNWKQRGTDPPASSLSAIADFFDISLNYLITGENQKTITELSDGEQELLTTYNKLDSKGRHKLHAYIYEELDHMERETHQKLKRDNE